MLFFLCYLLLAVVALVSRSVAVLVVLGLQNANKPSTKEIAEASCPVVAVPTAPVKKARSPVEVIARKGRFPTLLFKTLARRFAPHDMDVVRCFYSYHSIPSAPVKKARSPKEVSDTKGRFPTLHYKTLARKFAPHDMDAIVLRSLLLFSDSIVPAEEEEKEEIAVALCFDVEEEEREEEMAAIVEVDMQQEVQVEEIPVPILRRSARLAAKENNTKKEEVVESSSLGSVSVGGRRRSARLSAAPRRAR